MKRLALKKIIEIHNYKPKTKRVKRSSLGKNYAKLKLKSHEKDYCAHGTF